MGILRRVRWFHAVLAIAAAVISGGIAGAAAPNAQKLNVVFILVDDLGWTDLGCFGSDLYRTANVDRLAREGMRFSNAYAACTVCSPTRAAVMTGKYPARLHVTDWIAGHERPWAKLRIPDWTKYLPLEETTVAEALKPAGYFAGHVGKWHLGSRGYWPTDQGFDVNVAGYEAGQPPSYYWPYRRGTNGIPTIEITDKTKGLHLSERLALEASRLIRANKDRPFLLYLPTYEVHTPIEPKKDYVPAYRERLRPGLKHDNPEYAALVQGMDDLVGKVLSTLDELRIADRTVVFFTSDNGGLSHVDGVKRGPTDNAPLRAGKGSAYEGGVRVPLVVRWPGVARPGSICPEPVLSIDYFPTILEMAGTPGGATQRSPTPGAEVDGKSLVPLLKDPQARLAREAIYWHYPHYHPGGATPYGAIRARDWKLIEFYEDEHVELYHLTDDMGEKTDLAATMPEKAKELRAQLHAWRASVGAQMPTPNPQYDPDKDQPGGAAKPRGEGKRKPSEGRAEVPAGRPHKLGASIPSA